MIRIELEKQIKEESKCSSEQCEFIRELMLRNTKHKQLWLSYLTWNTDKLTKKSAGILIDALFTNKEFVIEELIKEVDKFTKAEEIKDTINNQKARENGLKFRQEVDESLFSDFDKPIYSYKGNDVMEVNLHCYKKKKVTAGNRTFFLGALTIQMIYLNIRSPENIDQKIRKEIFTLILNVNNKHCNPPLKKSEVIKSFNANFKKYESGEIDFKPYFKKQHAFWSKQTNLNGNEKRKITCKIKNEPIVIESKNRIHNAIQAILENGEKVTQVKVSVASGLSVLTIKHHWKEFKEFVKISNSESKSLKCSVIKL